MQMVERLESYVSSGGELNHASLRVSDPPLADAIRRLIGTYIWISRADREFESDLTPDLVRRLESLPGWSALASSLSPNPGDPGVEAVLERASQVGHLRPQSLSPADEDFERVIRRVMYRFLRGVDLHPSDASRLRELGDVWRDAFLSRQVRGD